MPHTSGLQLNCVAVYHAVLRVRQFSKRQYLECSEEVVNTQRSTLEVVEAAMPRSLLVFLVLHTEIEDKTDYNYKHLLCY